MLGGSLRFCGDEESAAPGILLAEHCCGRGGGSGVWDGIPSLAALTLGRREETAEMTRVPYIRGEKTRAQTNRSRNSVSVIVKNRTEMGGPEMSPRPFPRQTIMFQTRRFGACSSAGGTTAAITNARLPSFVVVDSETTGELGLKAAFSSQRGTQQRWFGEKRRSCAARGYAFSISLPATQPAPKHTTPLVRT